MRKALLYLLCFHLQLVALTGLPGTPEADDGPTQLADRCCKNLGISPRGCVNLACTGNPSYERTHAKCVTDVLGFITQSNMNGAAPLDRVARGCGSMFKVKNFIPNVELLLKNGWKLSFQMESLFHRLQNKVFCHEPKIVAGRWVMGESRECPIEKYNKNKPLKVINRSNEFMFINQAPKTKVRNSILRKVVGFKTAEFWEKYGREGLFCERGDIFRILDELLVVPDDYFQNTLEMYDEWAKERADESVCASWMVWKIDEFGKFYHHHREIKGENKISKDVYHSLFNFCSKLKTQPGSYRFSYSILDKLAEEKRLSIEIIISAIETMSSAFVGGGDFAKSDERLDNMINRLVNCVETGKECAVTAMKELNEECEHN